MSKRIFSWGGPYAGSRLDALCEEPSRRISTPKNLEGNFLIEQLAILDKLKPGVKISNSLGWSRSARSRFLDPTALRLYDSFLPFWNSESRRESIDSILAAGSCNQRSKRSLDSGGTCHGYARL